MIAVTNSVFNQDIIFILLTISLWLIAILKGSYWKHTKLLLMGAFAQRYANQFLREENAFTERVNLITFFLIIINFSVLGVNFLSNGNEYRIGVLILGVAFFFLIKKICILMLGSMFKMKDVARLGIFFSFLFDRFLAIAIFPFLVMLYFFSFDIYSELTMLVNYIFLSVIFLKIFSLWRIGTKSFGFSQIYIFLYLCSLEIIPLLLLGKELVYS